MKTLPAGGTRVAVAEIRSEDQMDRRFLVGLVTALAFAGVWSCGGNESPTEPAPLCTITIAPPQLAFVVEGGTGSITVTAPAGCSWSAGGGASWISVTAGASGNGSGTVTYSVAANPAAEARSATLTVGGQSHSITQAARVSVACTYALSEDTASFGAEGGSRTFAVTAPAGCGWTPVSNASWLTLTSGAGSGDGTVSYAVARYSDILERRATIVVADRTFTVRQSGDVSSCQYSVEPVASNACMPAGSITAALKTQDGCPWTVNSAAPWLSVTSGASATGSGMISMTYTDNYDAPREGVVMVRWPTSTAGQNIRLAQAGCRYAVSRDAIGFGAAGGSGTFDVLQQSDPTECGGATQDRCVWTATSDVPWITITSSMPRSGDNPVAFVVATNDGTTRVGTLSVRDKVVLITQSGR